VGIATRKPKRRTVDADALGKPCDSPKFLLESVHRKRDSHRILHVQLLVFTAHERHCTTHPTIVARGKRNILSMTTEEAITLARDLYAAKSFSAAWLARQLPDQPHRSSVHRWLTGEGAPADDSVWQAVGNILKSRANLSAEFVALAQDLALEVLTRGDSQDAKVLAERVIRQARIGSV
jgi:hypothetical protein